MRRGWQDHRGRYSKWVLKRSRLNAGGDDETAIRSSGEPRFRSTAAASGAAERPEKEGGEHAASRIELARRFDADRERRAVDLPEGEGVLIAVPFRAS